MVILTMYCLLYNGLVIIFLFKTNPSGVGKGLEYLVNYLTSITYKYRTNKVN
jgi:hypothetical protein